MVDAETRDVWALAQRLARDAGGLQRRRYETALRIERKSGATDLVTEVDRACEAHIVEELQRVRPGDRIVAEEGGGRGPRDAEWCWVIDPLDGTTNFAHGYPWFCVSIGVARAVIRTVAALYEPLRDELFEAVRGGGARRNGARIAVSRARSLGESLIATGFAYDVRQSRVDNLDYFARITKHARGIRRAGSAGLDLAAVACGRLDGYWETKLKPWDVAAGLLLVEEAGGCCTDLAGAPAPASGSSIVATNGAIHDELLAELQAAKGGLPVTP